MHEPESHSHIELDRSDLEGNGGIGRYVFLPGDPSRAKRIAEHFEGTVVHVSARGLNSYSGRLAVESGPAIDVLAISTGIGSASTEVVLHELIQCGARRLLRVGSCGTGASPIEPGQVVIATAAVRDELTTQHYAPVEFPAIAHPSVVAAMGEGARRCGLAEHTYQGVCHSKASLFGREFGHGPMAAANLEYCRLLKRCGVIASEMEASTLFVLAALSGGSPRPLAENHGANGCQAGAVLAVYGKDDSDMALDAALARLSEERAIRVALEGVRVWAETDRGGGAIG